MLKHSFSDFSYAVNIESAKKGHKEVLVCFIYNGIEVLKKVYIPEKAGTAYILEAKKIIDQEMRDGTLAIYSHRFINRNKRKRIQPKKVVAAAAKGEKIEPISTPADPSPKGNKKWVIATVVVAAIAVACATTAIVFATKGESEPGPGPTPTNYHVVSFDTQGGSSIAAQQVEEGKKVTKPTSPSRIGYDFEGWYHDASCTDDWDFDNDIVTSKITIYAHWTDGKNIHNITFDPQNGEATFPGEARNGERLVMPKTPSYDGYKFDGWYDATQGGSEFDFSTKFDSTTLPNNKLYAHWIANPLESYDVVFHLPTGGEIWTAEGTKYVVEEGQKYNCTFEIDSDYDFNGIEVYMGGKKLDPSKDEYAFIEGSKTLDIKAPANSAIHITVGSIKKSDVTISDYQWEPAGGEYGDNDVIVTGLNLEKIGMSKDEVLSVELKKTFVDPEDDQKTYNVVGFEKGVLEGYSSIQKLRIPFVGLHEDLEKDKPSLAGEHLFGALFGDKTFKGAETLTYQDYYEIPEGASEEQHYLIPAAVPSSLSKVEVVGASKIPFGAFSNCKYIQEIIINSAETTNADATIERYTCHGCSSLKNFSCSANFNKIETSAFEGCQTLANFDFSNIVYIGEYAFKDCLNLSNVYLPAGICDDEIGIIEKWAFENYEGLIKCYADSKPNKWDNYWCGTTSAVVYGLKNPDVAPITDSTNEYSCLIVGDSESNAESAYIIQYLGTVHTDKIVVPQKLKLDGEYYPVSHVGGQAFMDFIYTTEIDMSACDGLTSIGSYAFAKCYALTTIKFNASCTVDTIGTGAFAGCYNLSSSLSVFPSGVTTISNSAFKSCKSLTNVNFSSVTSVGDNAFEDCSSLTTIKLKSNQTALGVASFKNCESLKSVTYTNNENLNDATEGIIPDYCFYNTALTSIVVPTGITEIGEYAYALCSEAKTITINATGLTSIGSNAFLRCKNVNSSVTIPGTGLSTISIGASAFQDCYRLSGIDCKGKLQRIPDSVCYGDSGLGYFLYNSNSEIESIGAYAFAQDQNLDYVGGYVSDGKSDNLLSPKLRSIGDRAFINCVSIGRYGYSTTTPLTIRYESGATNFDMGEQVFYGWYTDYSDNDYQTLQIDSTWINLLRSSGVPGWNWSLTRKSQGAYYEYALSAEGGWGNLHIVPYSA